MAERESLWDAPSVGQLWRSMDPRDLKRDRIVRIERVDADFAYVKSFIGGKVGRQSRIHRSRFDGSEFRLTVRVKGDPW